MKCAFSHPISELKGHVCKNGGAFFRKTNGLNVLQVQRPKDYEVTPGQAYIREQFKAAIGAYDGISAANKELWNIWASENPVTVGGQKTTLSGAMWYRKLWTIASNGGDSLADAPPTIQPQGYITGLNELRWDGGNSRYVLKADLNDTVDHNDKFVFEVTPSEPTGRINYSEEALLLANRVELSGSTATEKPLAFITLLVYDWSFEWQVGEWCWMKVSHFSSEYWPGESLVGQIQVT